MITVTGSATHTATVTVSDPLGFGVSTTFTKTTPVTFTTSFTLAPVTGVPAGERLIRVMLGPLTVTAAHGGLLGPLADIITNVIIAFLDGTIREQAEPRLFEGDGRRCNGRVGRISGKKYGKGSPQQKGRG
jgi:hypothetical protein